MSFSLLKKELELFHDDLVDPNANKPKKKKIDPMKSISTNKKGVKKQLRKLNVKMENKRKARLKKMTSAADDYEKYQDLNNTTDNLFFINQLKGLESGDSHTVEKVVTQHRGKLSKNRLPETVEDEPQETVFTETDFKRFEEEYDFS